MPVPQDALVLRPEERLLVVAALGQREIAKAAWERWQQVVALDDTDAGSFAVLPAVSRNLDRHAIEHTLATKLRGIYRYAWSHAQTTFRDLLLSHDALTSAGVRAVTHKGLPVAARYLGDVAAIASDQVDLLVSAPDVERAKEALFTCGWRPIGPFPPLSVRRALDAHTFERVNRRRIVIWWRSFPLGCPSVEERALVDRARAHSVQGTDLLALQPTDQLLLACANVRALLPTERVRWTVEICAILAGAGGAIDDAAFVERAAAAELLPLCDESFEAVRLVASDGLPSIRVPSLPRGHGAYTTRVTVRRPRRGPMQRVIRSAMAVWRQYAAVCRGEGMPRTPWGFASFARAIYRHEWGVPATHGLARAATRRLMRAASSVTEPA